MKRKLVLRVGMVSATRAWGIFTLLVLGAGAGLAAEAAPRAWSSTMLRDVAAWPHSEQDARMAVTPRGLRVEVPQGRTYAIAPASQLLLPFGTLTAARLNAELGRHYDVDRLLHWCFGISDTRGGWGVTVGNWGGYDSDGLLGSIDNRGGYAFAMNTFAQAGALVPLVRYEPRYARAIGKWMLNLANAARLF